MVELSLVNLKTTIAKQLQYDENKIEEILKTIFEFLKETIQKNYAFEISGFGRIELTSDIQGQANLQDLSQNISQKFSLTETESSNIINNIFESFKEQILSGNCINLEDSIKLYITTQKAKIESDPKRGHKLISPAKRILKVSFNDEFLKSIGNKKLMFLVDEAFSSKIETTKEALILLIVSERDFFTRLLEYYFQKAGWKVYTSVSIVDAMQNIVSNGTYLVLVDSNLKNYQKLTEMIKVNRATSMIPLIIMFNNSSEMENPKELMVCGDTHIFQPFEVKKLLNLADSELIRSQEEVLIFEQQVLFQFPTSDENLDKANELIHKLYETSGLREEDQIAMGAAFREAIGNAAQHGNKFRRDKKVQVLYLLDSEKVTVQIKDQGVGFDHEKYVRAGMFGDALTAARERHREGRLGGLGIMLMLKCTDKLEYNDVGNAVTLTKFIKRK